MNHKEKLVKILADLQAAIIAGDATKCCECICDCWKEIAALSGAKTTFSATPAESADVVAAVEGCEKAAVAAAATPPVMKGFWDSDIWAKLLRNIPAILAILRDLFAEDAAGE